MFDGKKAQAQNRRTSPRALIARQRRSAQGRSLSTDIASPRLRAPLRLGGEERGGPMFNERKAAQIAAYFIEKAGGNTEVLKLTKWMYLAERHAMEKHGFPMTFDYPVSMPHGPALSYTLGYVNGEWEPSQDGWDHWIRHREGRQVSLVREQVTRDDLDELSDQDVGVLNDVWKQFGHMTASQLRKYTHEKLKEWKDPSGSSRPISTKDIFLALGRSPDAAEAQAKEVEKRRKIRAALKAA